MELLLLSLFVAALFSNNDDKKEEKHHSRRYHCNGLSFRSSADMEDYKNAMGLK